MKSRIPTKAQLLRALEFPLATFAQQCHVASLRLVKSGVFGDTPARVARGWCTGVTGQHSWVVIGTDCYDEGATIIDPTLWSYDATVRGIWIGTMADGKHLPHGHGSIWDYGRPSPPVGPIIKIKPPRGGWSREARDFLRMVGPLDARGWNTLVHSPVGGWPAGEIIGAVAHDKRLRGIVPIDRIGMLTDINPGGLYLDGPADVAA